MIAPKRRVRRLGHKGIKADEAPLVLADAPQRVGGRVGGEPTTWDHCGLIELCGSLYTLTPRLTLDVRNILKIRQTQSLLV